MWELRDFRAARKSNFDSPIIFEAGERVGLYCKDMGVNADNIVVTVYLLIIEQTESEFVDSWTGKFPTP